MMQFANYENEVYKVMRMTFTSSVGMELSEVRGITSTKFH